MIAFFVGFVVTWVGLEALEALFGFRVAAVVGTIVVLAAAAVLAGAST